MGAPGAVVVGGSVNALGVVRALAARGIPVGVVTTKPYDIAHRSRSVSGHVAAPDLHERPEALAEALERRRTAWAGWALVPTNDEALAALAADGLGSSRHVLAPSPGAIGTLLDKRAMSDAAQAVGVEVPRSYGPAEPGVARRADLRFPVVVKPLATPRFFARFGCKLGVAHDRAELAAWVEHVHAAHTPGVVLDLVPGPDHDIYAHCTYLDARGAPVGGRLVRKLRQGPAGFGNARVAEVVAQDPVLQEATVEIARRIGIRGIVVAEFKRDARDGSMRFFEVNGRSVAYNALLRRAGLDLAALAWDDHAGGAGLRSAEPEWRGAWFHLRADCVYSALERVLPHRYRPGTVEAVWSPRDPAPFAAEWRRTATLAAARLRGSGPPALPSHRPPASSAHRGQ